MQDYLLSIKIIAQSTEFPCKTLLNWIIEGLIPSDPVISSETFANGIPDGYENTIRIPASTLWNVFVRKCVLERFLQAEAFSIDFIGFRHSFGDAAYTRLLDEIQRIKEFSSLNNKAPGTTSSAKQEYARIHGYSVSTLYRKEQLFMKTDLKKLLSKPTGYHSKQLCPLAEDYVSYQYFLPNAVSQNSILRKLQNEADRIGKPVCNRCPHNPNTAAYRKYVTKYQDSFCACYQVGNGMIIPQNRYPINRYLQQQNEQYVVYGRKGPNVWKDIYLHKTKRDFSNIDVNSCWFGDHHIADVVVLIGQDKNGKPQLARPWLTVVTDAASGAIVGSVVSLHPNSDTIAECFCRAAAFTVDSPFYGLCEVFYVDRGRDYRATILEGRDHDMRTRLEQHYYLNRTFCDNPLLPALNVTVRHALPRTGRSKVIERTFGTVTREWFQKIPGWVGNCPDNRPFDYYREQKKLLASGGLWTLEKFARYWFEEIVPAYNNFAPEKGKETPLALYESVLSRANTIIPDWNTLAVFKTKKNTYKVHAQGIKYGKDDHGEPEFYWHPDMRDLIGEKVMVYDFDATFCHSLSILHNGKYICEAEPLVHQNILEPDRLKLSQHLEEQKAQKRHISRRVSMLPQVLKSAKCSAERYTQYEPEDDLITDENPCMYAETVDSAKDASDATVLSNTANTLAQIAEAQKTAISHILNGPAETQMTDFFIRQCQK